MNRPTDWVLWANPKHPWHRRHIVEETALRLPPPPVGADLIFILAMTFCLGMMAGAALVGILAWVML